MKLLAFLVVIVVIAFGGGLLVLLAYGVGLLTNPVLGFSPFEATALSLIAILGLLLFMVKAMSLTSPFHFSPTFPEQDNDETE